MSIQIIKKCKCQTLLGAMVLMLIVGRTCTSKNKLIVNI